MLADRPAVVGAGLDTAGKSRAELRMNVNSEVTWINAASSGFKKPNAASPTPTASTARVPKKLNWMMPCARRAIRRVSTNFDNRSRAACPHSRHRSCRSHRYTNRRARGQCIVHRLRPSPRRPRPRACREPAFCSGSSSACIPSTAIRCRRRGATVGPSPVSGWSDPERPSAQSRLRPAEQGLR